MAETLFVAHRAPWPPDRGDRIRSWHILDALLRRGPVHVAALADNAADAEIARDHLAPLCASVTLDIRRPSRVAALARALPRRLPLSVEAFNSDIITRSVAGRLDEGRINTIFAFSGQAAQFVPREFAGRFVMDFVDVDSAKFEEQARDAGPLSPMRWVLAREGHVLARYERAIAARADLSLFVSEAEAGLFRRRSGLSPARVRALENGIDTDRFDPGAAFAPLAFDERPLGPLCVFTGQMDYRPNVDAVIRFARDVLPLIRARVPAAAFAIVGRAPTKEIRALEALPGVHVTGEVDDVRPWLAAADAVVAPLLLARGIQNKVLEAMAMARAVVASAAAAQGIDAAAGRELIVADSLVDQAEAVAGLLRDPLRRTILGRAARARMIARYGWAATLAPLDDLLAAADKREAA